MATPCRLFRQVSRVLRLLRRPIRATTRDFYPLVSSTRVNLSHMHAVRVIARLRVLYPRTCRRRYPKLPIAGCLTPNSAFLLASSASQSVLLGENGFRPCVSSDFRLAYTWTRRFTRATTGTWLLRSGTATHTHTRLSILHVFFFPSLPSSLHLPTVKMEPDT